MWACNECELVMNVSLYWMWACSECELVVNVSLYCMWACTECELVLNVSLYWMWACTECELFVLNESWLYWMCARTECELPDILLIDIQALALGFCGCDWNLKYDKPVRKEKRIHQKFITYLRLLFVPKLLELCWCSCRGKFIFLTLLLIKS
jgi:hypothetical protein